MRDTLSDFIGLFIDGRVCPASDGGQIAIENPATGAVIGQLACATDEDLDRALAAAEVGFALWRDTPALERSKILRRGADLLRERGALLAAQISLQQGKPLAEARMEAANCADVLDWYAEEGRRGYGRVIPARQSNVLQYTVKDPIGPVAAFSPWNFPASQGVRKLAAALAAGCAMILKGPEEAPGPLALVAQALHDAGLPNGVLNLVFGVPAAISARLIAAPVIRKVSFTGSVPVGKLIARQAAEAMKPCTMELGGHAPVLVCEDVDIEAVTSAMARMKVLNAGQVCVSPTRFLVAQSIADAVEEQLVRKLAAIRVGPGDQPDSQMGPLASTRRLSAVRELIEDALARGARLATGGDRIGNAGNFLAPTLLADVPDDARILHEEPFGPVATLNRFDTLDNALRQANATNFGLAAYAFTKDADTIATLSKRLEAGMIGINGFGVGPIETPFGGIQDSGYGREGGSEGLDAYTVTRFVTTTAGH